LKKAYNFLILFVSLFYLFKTDNPIRTGEQQGWQPLSRIFNPAQHHRFLWAWCYPWQMANQFFYRFWFTVKRN